MIKKFSVILCLIVVLTLNLTACNPKEVSRAATEPIPATEEATEEISPTEPIDEVTEEPVIEEVEETKATRTPRPTNTPKPPEFFQDTGFPIGKFTSDATSTIIHFGADGSCLWEWQPGMTSDCLYGVNGDLWSHMWFTYSNFMGMGVGTIVPATYYWEFDGSHLTFHLYGIDLRSRRLNVADGKTYTYKGPSILGTEVREQTFPTGRFVNADGTRAFAFDEDGYWRFFEGDLENPVLSGKYVTNGEYYTEMTHDNPEEQQVPVTYTWSFDGENLTFELWGEDVIPYRESIYNGQTYIWVEE